MDLGFTHVLLKIEQWDLFSFTFEMIMQHLVSYKDLISQYAVNQSEPTFTEYDT